MRPTLALALTSAALGCAALAGFGAQAAVAASVSSNWAGYVALPSAQHTARFASVSGSWRAPAATCSSGRETYSAVWDGLGGYGESSSALEQIGTEANCSRTGRPSYAAWWEIIPAAPVRISMKITPGDEITASATVHGHDVTLRIRDLSTGARFSITRRSSAVDLSSAEWIVEAPSVCRASDSCSTLPLTNFGTVLFSGAYATAAAHTGTITDQAWSDEAIELREGELIAPGGAGRRQGPERVLLTAAPTTPSATSGSFSVSYRERTGGSGPVQLPTFPGLNST